MADEAVEAVEVADNPGPAEDPDAPRPSYTALAGIETDSMRLDVGEQFTGEGLTSEQMGHLIAIGAIHLTGTDAPALPQPELIDPDLVAKMAALAQAAANPEPLKSLDAPEADPAADAEAQRAAALNALLHQIAPDATPEQVAAADAALGTGPVA